MLNTQVNLLKQIPEIGENKDHIDNHSSGYLGMEVQHCVRAYLGPHCMYLGSEAILPKANGTAEFYSLSFFTSVCVF